MFYDINNQLFQKDKYNNQGDPLCPVMKGTDRFMEYWSDGSKCVTYDYSIDDLKYGLANSGRESFFDHHSFHGNELYRFILPEIIYDYISKVVDEKGSASVLVADIVAELNL